jgi:hypothetical protein
VETLAEYLTPEEIERESFAITDTSKAMWAMRKIAQARAQIASNHQIAQAEIDKILTWNKKASEKEERTVEFMEAHIMAYYNRMREKDPDYKLDLPTGKVRRRKLPQSYEVDDAGLIAWAEQHAQDVLQITKAVQWGELKKRIAAFDGSAMDTTTGEIIPGITPKPIQERVWVEVSE